MMKIKMYVILDETIDYSSYIEGEEKRFQCLVFSLHGMKQIRGVKSIVKCVCNVRLP